MKRRSILKGILALVPLAWAARLYSKPERVVTLDVEVFETPEWSTGTVFGGGRYCKSDPGGKWENEWKPTRIGDYLYPGDRMDWKSGKLMVRRKLK